MARLSESRLALKGALVTVAVALVANGCSSTPISSKPASIAERATVTAGTAQDASTAGTARRPAPPFRHQQPALTTAVALPAPAPLAPFSSTRLPGEGLWRPAGRLVQGRAAVYETVLRPPGSSYEAGIAWMDPRLLRAQLYSGSASPGSGPWKLTAPVSPVAARTLVAAFNGGFKFPATEGGYYAEGRLVYPLRPGGASLVIYRNGDATVGSWGKEVRMTPDVIAVRQNLTLVVDGGKPVARLNPADTWMWGSTLGGVPAVWRSGIGVTATGALVYVTGPSLEITQLAEVLVRAGCVHAMTLDMNPDWTVFVAYRPTSSAHGQAAPGNGAPLLPGMVQGPFTFFEAWWARDFITMSAR